MLTLLPKGVQAKKLKFFSLKIFAICHRCQRHRWGTLSCEYLREFSKKFETALLVYSGAWGKLIHEKKQKSKISWHCPFKGLKFFNPYSILGNFSLKFQSFLNHINVTNFPQITRFQSPIGLFHLFKGTESRVIIQNI